jgi:CHAD domain-containing protein
MKPQEIIDWFAEQHRVTVLHLRKYEKKKDPEAMHQVRVSMKKIRVYLGFLETYGRHRKQTRKIHRQLNKFFREAGCMREIQVHLYWLVKHHKQAIASRLKLKSQLRKKENAFIRQIPSIISELDSLFSSAITCHPANLGSGKAKKFLDRSFDHVCRVLFTKPGPEEWHELRKKIKLVLYCRNWLDEEALRSHVIFSYLSDLDHLQDHIGKWHDLLLLSHLLQAEWPDDEKGAATWKTMYDMVRQAMAGYHLRIKNEMTVLRRGMTA